MRMLATVKRTMKIAIRTRIKITPTMEEATVAGMGTVMVMETAMATGMGIGRKLECI
jgi:hypothetical protein